ncbi:MAG: ATP-binding protein [Clostridia bacterium]|nr:ATP-binding protein [Clostridia bacterium]
MATREMILRQLDDEYQARRERNEALTLRRRAEAAAACPEIGQLLNRRQELIFNGMRGILSGKRSGDDLEQRMAEINDGIRGLLKANGFEENWLEPVFTCAECRDTGYTGEQIREQCGCRVKRYGELMRAQMEQQETGESFETFDPELLPDEKLPKYGLSQREITLMIRDRCVRWCDAYPDTKYRNILLYGPTGTGKTFLMNAIAHRLRARGHEVVNVTAYRFLTIAREAWFSGMTEEMEELLNAEVLCLDDVGTEPLMANVTVEQMFLLINERCNKGLTTVMSTNLDTEKFRERYSERVASRVTDSRNSLVLQLTGCDLRRKGGK